jgi:hypothetical protein
MLLLLQALVETCKLNSLNEMLLKVLVTSNLTKSIKVINTSIQTCKVNNSKWTNRLFSSLNNSQVNNLIILEQINLILDLNNKTWINQDSKITSSQVCKTNNRPVYKTTSSQVWTPWILNMGLISNRCKTIIRVTSNQLLNQIIKQMVWGSKQSYKTNLINNLEIINRALLNNNLVNQIKWTTININSHNSQFSLNRLNNRWTKRNLFNHNFLNLHHSLNLLNHHHLNMSKLSKWLDGIGFTMNNSYSTDK